eukprot:Sdes_comp14228_c0_seq1m3440
MNRKSQSLIFVCVCFCFFLTFSYFGKVESAAEAKIHIQKDPIRLDDHSVQQIFLEYEPYLDNAEKKILDFRYADNPSRIQFEVSKRHLQRVLKIFEDYGKELNQRTIAKFIKMLGSFENMD